MPTAAEIEARLRPLCHDPLSGGAENVPRYLHAVEWLGRSDMYLAAAEELAREPDLFSFARIQLSGHAIECALKAAIVTFGRRPERHHHDLSVYADTALALGVRMSEPELVIIVNVNQHYFRSLWSGAKFKARYPTEKFESTREPRIEHQAVARVLGALRPQIESANDERNKQAWLKSGYGEGQP